LIKSTYHFLHRTTVTLILLLVAVTILLTHKYTLVFLAQKFLKTNHIEYSKVEGTLFNGIILYDVNYKNIIRAKKLQLNYKLLSFIELKPIIKNIQTQQLYINIDKLPSTGTSNDFELVPFKILKLNLNKSTIIIDQKKYFFNLTIKDLLYDRTFNTDYLSLDLKSYYVNAAIQAKIINNTLIGHSNNVVIKHKIRQEYLSFIQSFPKYLSVDIKLNTKKVDLRTHIPTYSLTADKNITFHDQNLDIEYLIPKNIFVADTRYTMAYKNYLSTISQKATFNINGEFNSSLHTQFHNFAKSIPVRDVDANLSGDTHHIQLDANSSNFILHMSSNNYKKYRIKLTNQQLKLSFLNAIPEFLKEHTFAFDSYSTLRLSPLSIEGVVHTADKFTHINATYKYNSHYKQIAAEIQPIKTNPLYKEYDLHLISPFKLNYKQRDKRSTFLVDANQLHAFITKDEQNRLTGDGNFTSILFTLNGNIDEDMNTNLKLHTSIASIKELLHDVNLSSSRDKTEYDGSVNINSNIHFNKHFSIQSTIKAPYLSAKTDSQNRYVLKDVLFKTSYKHKKIYIYNYKLAYKEQKFHSNNTSVINVDRNVSFHIDKFYVYNKLILKGTIDPLESRMKLNLHSEKFHFKTRDIDVNAKTNINIDVTNTQKQVIDGNITLLGGTISYQPQHDYAISDDDIIIVQDIQKQKQNNLFLNLHINADKAIRYKIKDIDVHFIPKITLKKVAGDKIKIYGKIIVLNGFIMAKSKEFTFDRSELIFLGEKHLNPELNIKLHYQTVDYKDIIIRISNTLNSPVLIFSSNPAMSQNDIMSYILFDEPADTLFDNSSQVNRTSINYLLLGTGIKTIFNQTTGIHVDTLNILNNENGTLGYEIGARLNKKVRVVYKNDVTSSMILQYSLGKSVRIDVDVHDTGQGVSFIYTKDFKGF